MQVEVVKNDNGDSKHISVERKVVEPEEFESLQRRIAHVARDFTPFSGDKLHMTVFYLGRPESLFGDFRSLSSALSYEVFIQEFSELMRHIHSRRFHQEVLVRRKGLDVFGNIVVQRVEEVEGQGNALSIERESIWDCVRKFVMTLGFSDVDRVIRSCPTFKYQFPETRNPHISLGVLNCGNPILPSVSARVALLHGAKVENVIFKE